VVPKIKNLDEKRNQKRKQVRSSWSNYIETLRTEHSLFLRPERVGMLADQMISQVYFDFTRGDVEYVRKQFDQWMLSNNGIFDTYGSKVQLPNDFFNTLFELFQKNWIDIKSERSEIIENYEQFINVKIINYMSTKIEKI